MKSTVLKASKGLANQIATELLLTMSKTGKQLFEKVEINNGFEIKSIVRGTVVLRFTDDNGMKKIDYEERLITLC